MEYNLNLTKDYCSHWGLSEAVRELIANNIDEHGQLTYDHEQNMLVLTTEKELPIEAFLMGYSVKDSENAIGQYGEGLKLAMLVLTRLNQEFSFMSGHYMYRFSFKTPSVMSDNGSIVNYFFGISTLHVEQVDMGDTIVPTTMITVFDLPYKYVDNIYTAAPLDTILSDKKGIFCQGLLVDKDFYIKFYDDTPTIIYGVNLSVGFKGNRDRNYFPDKKLIVPIIEKYFEPQRLLSLSTSMSESDIYNNLSDPYKQEIAKYHFLKSNPIYKYEDLNGITILVPNSDDRYSKARGYLVSKQWYYGYYLMNQEQRNILHSLIINDNEYDSDALDTKAEASRKERIVRLLTDFSLSTDVYDLTTRLVQYIPNLKDHRDKFAKAVRIMVEDLIAGNLAELNLDIMGFVVEEETSDEETIDED